MLPFFDMAECVEAVIAAPAHALHRFESLAAWYLPGKRVRVVAGGETRQDSVGRALQAAGADSDLVLIHDAARPLVRGTLIRRVLDGMRSGYAAAAPALAIVDTVKRAHGTPLTVECTVDRAGLYAVQTPQALRREVAEVAYQRLAADRFEGTDDVSLVEHFQLGVILLVDGDPENVKVTTTADLQFVQVRLPEIR